MSPIAAESLFHVTSALRVASPHRSSDDRGDTENGPTPGWSGRPRHGSRLASGCIAALVALSATACTTGAAPAGTETMRASAAPTSASIAPSLAPSSIATSNPSEPTPWEGVHVATGLALVRFPEAGAPASQVFVVDADGDPRQLTGQSRVPSLGASLPAWSPDGRQLAFGPAKVGAATSRFLSVIEADGSEERSLAPLGDEFGVPFGWSPDGATLLFFDIDAVHGPAMWLADVVSGTITSLGPGQGPRWLPDGRHISFQRGVEGLDPADPRALTEVIYVMSLDDGEVVEFGRASDAIWAPDGSTVLLQQAAGDLLIANADGTSPRPFVHGWAPVWSPDASVIVFASGHDGEGTPLLAAIDGDGELLWSGVAGASPSWSPDGTRLAVELSYPEPVVEVLDAATGEVLWRGEGSQPAWRP